MQLVSNVTRKSPILKKCTAVQLKRINHYKLKVWIATLYVSQDIRRIAVFATLWSMFSNNTTSLFIFHYGAYAYVASYSFGEFLVRIIRKKI